MQVKSKGKLYQLSQINNLCCQQIWNVKEDKVNHDACLPCTAVGKKGTAQDEATSNS